MSKIYELAEQAAEYAVVNASEMNLESELGEVKVVIPKEFIDKFSELLIRACMAVVKDINQEYDSGEWSVNAADEIGEYFGVEE